MDYAPKNVQYSRFTIYVRNVHRLLRQMHGGTDYTNWLPHRCALVQLPSSSVTIA